MKKIIYILLLLITITSCQVREIELYSDQDDQISFISNDLEVTQSFVFDLESTVKDTLWLDVRNMGFIRDYDRPILLKQVEQEGVNNAVADMHYISFNNKDIVNHYMMKAGKHEASLPIIFLRDPSLKNVEHELHIEIAENEFYSLGTTTTKIIIIVDGLSEPSNWKLAKRFVGEYGIVKHDFLNIITKEDWDEAYIDKLSNDSSLGYYWKEYAIQELVKHNKWLETQTPENGGPGPLMEANGDNVEF